MTQLLNNIDLTNIDELKKKGSFEKLTWLDNLLIGSKIEDISQLDILKLNNIQFAIDFKEKNETSFDDQSAFESYGINYLNFPVSDINDLSFEDLCFLKREIEKYPGKKFLYCRSANRVGAIISLMLAEVIGHARQRSYRVGCQIGLNNEGLMNKVKNRLSISQEAS